MKTFKTHGAEYTIAHLRGVRAYVEEGVPAPEAVRKVLPDIAATPAAVQAVITAARQTGLIRFDQAARKWAAADETARLAGRRRISEGEMKQHSVYVPEELWQRLKRQYGCRLQERIREALTASLGAA